MQGGMKMHDNENGRMTWNFITKVQKIKQQTILWPLHKNSVAMMLTFSHMIK